MNDIKIGIPKALLYYKYGDLWCNFFNELGYTVVCSPDTNNEILEFGKNLSVDENCLSLKIFIGHVHYLVDKADYILIPRIRCVKKKEKLCIAYNALYDIINNTFNANIIVFDIDVEAGLTEKKAFINMGKKLGNKMFEIIKAYKRAKRIEKRSKMYRYMRQAELFNNNKPKILLISHSYNSYDAFVAGPIVKCLNELGVEVIYADVFNEKEIKNKYKEISTSIYWTYNKELFGSIVCYKDKVDGIILLSSFPCGPDSLTNEICMRKLKLPIINIIVDELSNDAGMQTRIESFIDIISEKKKVTNERKNY